MAIERLRCKVCLQVIFAIISLQYVQAITTPSPNAVDQFIPGVNIPDGTSGGWSLTPDDSFMVFPTATDKVTPGVIVEETPAPTTSTTTTTTTTPSATTQETTTETTTTILVLDTTTASAPVMHPDGGGPNLVGHNLGNNFPNSYNIPVYPPRPAYHHPNNGGYHGNIPWWLLLFAQEP